MTKHNLRENLKWLVRTSSKVPNLHFTSSEEHTALENLQVPLDSQGNPREQVPQAHAELRSAPIGHATQQASDVEFLRPSLPASALSRRDRDAMARLQSEPKSSNKSRLLSEQAPVSSRNPLPARGDAIPSLKDNYTAHFSRATNGTIYLHLRSTLFKLTIL